MIPPLWRAIVAVIGQHPSGTDLLVAGKFNTYLDSLNRHEGNGAISTAMATEGMGYIMEHFISRQLPWTRDIRMCSMIRRGQ